MQGRPAKLRFQTQFCLTCCYVALVVARACTATHTADGKALRPIEVLRQENQLLKEAITESRAAIITLEKELRAAGVRVPVPEGLPEPVPIMPEDYWSPTLEVGRWWPCKGP